MRTFLRDAPVAGGVALATTAGLYALGITPWSGATTVIPSGVFASVVVLAGLCAGFDRRETGSPQAAMRLSFIAEVVTLILCGAAAMTLVGTASAAVRALVARKRPQPVRRGLVDVVTAIVATQTAGAAHTILRGTAPPLDWPFQALSIGVAILAYTLVLGAAARVLMPLVTGQSPARTWARDVLRACPSHIVGAVVAVGLAEAVGRAMWMLLPLTAVPLYFAWVAYRRAAPDRWSRDSACAAQTGAAAVDADGRLTVWSTALSHLLDCPMEQAIGRTIVEAVPALSDSDVPAAVHDALQDGTPRILANLELSTRSAHRLLTVTIVPDADGALLFWRDTHDPTLADASPDMAAERFALIAEGANDGLWELNARTHALYVSPRWLELLGLPITETMARRDDWFARVHVDDVPGLRAALDAPAGGPTNRVEHEFRMRHKDGTYRRVLCRGVVVRDRQGKVRRLAGSLTDVTENAAAREQALSAGLRDPLTGLLNRAAFIDALSRRLDAYRNKGAGRFAALSLDLDRFKVVNDSLGHLIGDELLVAVARRLEPCTRPGDHIARIGGDEFAILLHGLDDAMQANVAAFRMQEALSKPLTIGGRQVVTSASIGIAFSRIEYENAEEIMRDADTALHHAKTHGKARHELYDADMQTRTHDRLGLEADLRDAVKNSAFELYYQPIVALGSRMCVGFEALIRWKRNGKFVSPADFIPMAEELGLIEPLGGWVLHDACRTFVAWQRRFPAFGLDFISVNVSARQLVQQGFLNFVEQTLEQTGLRPFDLRLEITETALMDAPRAAAKVLQDLRASGVKIYLDDFGTGYSSLSHLHKLPVDALKIDQSFVRGLLADDRPAIVESILALARTLHTSVVAEGVEDERQVQQLERLGCRHAQGYFFARPLTVEAVEQMLVAGVPLGAPRVTRPSFGDIDPQTPSPQAPPSSTTPSSILDIAPRVAV